MKKLFFIFFFLLLLLIGVFNIDFPLSNNSIYGKYINTNYSNPICCVEAPHKLDTLFLMKNGKFYSNFYGVGKYKIINGLNPEIALEYSYNNQKAIYKTYFSNKLFQKTRIILNADLDHYYEKMSK